MFILIMQFLWKYIDDLMGKGLNSWIILELLFFVSASLIPLALPLAILLSSIMTFGNFAETNELTALKSSGLSLYQIMKPLTVVVVSIALFTFYFANYVIPVANFKWHSLIYDIQNTKISTIITPGVYSKELDGYAIKISEGDESHFKEILIHDHTMPNEIKTIRAKDGKIYKSENGKHVFFELNDGYVNEELAPQAPSYLPNGKLHPNSFNQHPSRRSTFDKGVYKIDLQGFSFQRSDDKLFADKHEMLNVFQIYHSIDSINQNKQKISDDFSRGITNEHSFIQSLHFKSDSLNGSYKSDISSMERPKVIDFKRLNNNEKLLAIQLAQSKLRRKNQTIQSQLEYLNSIDRDIDGYWIEFHRKFALTYAIVVLFFIGAPLGAIVKKGGFGAPVVIASLLFMIYFVLISIGESLASSQVVSPFIGMWFASFVLSPIAYLFMRAAANDSPVFSKESWFKKIKIAKTKNATPLSHA